ncbi:conserved hypothetical protein [Cupriavidus taiwanensis]|uniref:thiamine biosynthesis protein ThiF n=1 Tax=Cupriavidus taiwanensis TaxID=164546 RepID=UPI000E141DBE|nr:thiamine biosynthesis protein ThiF [Cupriavidus taiwanensis]SPA36210.1 conserved hypothetical protein [Cupriavidus taiwanensis]
MHADSFHRLMKLLVDSGECATLEDALATFAGYGVRLVLSDDVASSPAQQIIALTVINAAARSFQGNVQVSGNTDLVLSVPGFVGVRLSQFESWVGVNPACQPTESWPEICLGTRQDTAVRKTLRPWASGWTFGIGGQISSLASAETFGPACVAAGALAVSEAFSMLRCDNPYAGRRAISFSLWSMKNDTAHPRAGTSTTLDGGLWLVGLGHLGQAYCWTLGLMADVVAGPLVLQDIDIVTPSTLTTSVLSSPADLKRKKTRVVADWMEHRGFETRIVERRFDAGTCVAAGEPMTALFGVDNASARRTCEGAGFSLVLDAGLGSGHKDFRSLRVRGFPGASSADRIWASEAETVTKPLASAYQALLAAGKEPCGVTTLATRAVGAPFVGCYASAVLIAELLRRNAGLTGNSVLDISLRSPEAVELG